MVDLGRSGNAVFAAAPVTHEAASGTELDLWGADKRLANAEGG